MGLTQTFEHGVRLFKITNKINNEVAVYVDRQKRDRTPEEFVADVLQGINEGHDRSYHKYFKEYGTDDLIVEKTLIESNITKRQAELVKRSVITTLAMSTTWKILNPNSGKVAGTGLRYVA